MAITSEFSNLQNLTQLRTDCTCSLGSTSWQSNSWNIRLFWSFLVRRSVRRSDVCNRYVKSACLRIILALATKYGTKDSEQCININVLNKSKETAIKMWGEMWNVYDDETTPRSNLLKWHKISLGSREYMHNNSKSGRSKTTKTEEKVENSRYFSKQWSPVRLECCSMYCFVDCVILCIICV